MKPSKQPILPVLALALLVTCTGYGQGVITYMSSLEAASGGYYPVASDSWIAHGFVTGSNSTGYTLRFVDLLMSTSVGSPAGFTLSLYNCNGIFPGEAMWSLTGPSNPASAGVFRYTGSGIALEPLTVYFVVATATRPQAMGSYSWQYPAASTNSSVVATGGWELWHDFHSVGGSAWERNIYGGTLQFAISASPVPEPTVTSILLVVMVLYWLTRHRSR